MRSLCSSHDPKNKFNSVKPLATTEFFGIRQNYSIWNTPCLCGFDNYKGHFYFHFYIPTTGWYIIDILAGGRNSASLTDPFSGLSVQVLQTWNIMNSPDYWNDYITMQYLIGGGDFTFLFIPEFDYFQFACIRVASIRITSYP
jgi:hypothetical protein